MMPSATLSVLFEMGPQSPRGAIGQRLLGQGLDELDFAKDQLTWLPTRAYVSRMATGSVWALIAALALMLMR